MIITDTISNSNQLPAIYVIHLKISRNVDFWAKNLTSWSKRWWMSCIWYRQSIIVPMQAFTINAMTEVWVRVATICSIKFTFWSVCPVITDWISNHTTTEETNCKKLSNQLFVTISQLTALGAYLYLFLQDVLYHLHNKYNHNRQL